MTSPAPIVIWGSALLLFQAGGIAPEKIASLYEKMEGVQVVSVDTDAKTVVYVATRLDLADSKGQSERLQSRASTSGLILIGKAILRANPKDVEALTKRVRAVLGPEAKLKQTESLPFEMKLELDRRQIWHRLRANGSLEETRLTVVTASTDKEPKEAVLTARLYWEQDVPAVEGRIVINWTLVQQAVRSGHVRFEAKGKGASQPDAETLALFLKDRLMRNLLNPVAGSDPEGKPEPKRPLEAKNRPKYTWDVTYEMTKDVEESKLDSAIDLGRSHRVQRTLVLSATATVVR
jgi:hypothetical protein